jgi:multidrug efflux system membrane fusion protein
VEIGLDNEAGFPHVGRLDFVDNKVNRETGTIQARGVFEDPNACLSPGLYVRVRIPFGLPRPALLVPDRAIGTDLKTKFLLAVDGTNIVVRRSVELGSLHDGLREIRSGIGPEDRIIVEGLQRVQSGSTVSPKPLVGATHTVNAAASVEARQEAGPGVGGRTPLERR